MKVRLQMMSLLLGWLMSISVFAAGTLVSVNTSDQPLRIENHHAHVILNNGFSRTEVTQTFHNPNPHQVEGVYVCPVPRSASLAEYEATFGELVLSGEVLTKSEAEKIYGEVKDSGEEAGLASKDPFDVFRFSVTPIGPDAKVKIRYVYYQPIEIDTSVGRYVYPLEEGGTDEAAASFWHRREKVEQEFRFTLELKSGWPVDQLRLPGFEQETVIDQLGEGHYQVELSSQKAALNKDVVVYYRLADNLPGRLELLTYRPDANRDGTFMLILTPGVDLQPLQNGADYVFVMDLSGSMQGKMGGLIEGVNRALGELSGNDRFALVSFSDRAKNLTGGYLAATPDGVQDGLDIVRKLELEGGTNLMAGLREGLAELEDDRATTLVLLSDAVANRGELNPRSFYKLMTHHDIRFFGFLMGNNSNWPLMAALCEASGGSFSRVSGSDDLIGRVLQAKGKVISEALHDAKVDIRGVRTSDVVGASRGKIFRGEQMVIFGRYSQPGKAKLTLKARITGVDKTYATEVDFPEVSTEHPELERLWALAAIEDAIVSEQCGFIDHAEMKKLTEKLGVSYQLVTDFTSMVALREETFEKYGVKRQNRTRVATEKQAQQFRAAKGPTNFRADKNKPMFKKPAPSIGGGGSSGGGGGGALSPWWALALIASGFGMWRGGHRQ